MLLCWCCYWLSPIVNLYQHERWPLGTYFRLVKERMQTNRPISCFCCSCKEDQATCQVAWAAVKHHHTSRSSLQVRIAQAHLLPKLLAEHGLRHHALEVGPEAMMALVDG